MSFILDALKKSEAERSRQNGPHVLEFRPGRASAGLPWWAVLIGVALVANLAVLTYALLREPQPAAVVLPVAPAAPASATAPAGAAAPLADDGAGAALPAIDELRPVLPDPALAATPLPPAADALPPEPAGLPPRAGAGTGGNVYTAPAPAAAPPRAAGGSNLPSAQDLAAAGAGVPELRISLHVYDALPANRYVLLNGTRLREGEATADGVRLVEVTESGVVLEWRGRRFTAQPGG